MQNYTNKQPCIRKHATVLKYENGIATVRIHNNNNCQNCSSNKQSNCALYSFGSIFSRNTDVRQLPSKHSFDKGEQVQLVIQSNTLLKIATLCYGLPIVLLIANTTLVHLLANIEWLTIIIGLSSLIASYLFVKRWLRSIYLPNIQLTQ